MTLANRNTPCNGGCGKVRSILYSDSPAQWMCFECAHSQKHSTPRTKFINTTWELRSYEVWGNSRDGYEVNDSFRAGEVTIQIKVEVNNAGTPQEFLSAYPTNTQIRSALGLRRFRLDLEGDDTTIYVNRARDGYPCGEMYCTSHESLSPIRTVSTITTNTLREADERTCIGNGPDASCPICAGDHSIEECPEEHS